MFLNGIKIMLAIELLLKDIENAVFFDKVNQGFFDIKNNVIFIPDVKTAFIEPNETLNQYGFKNAKWLPSDIFDIDPFYGKVAFDDDIKSDRKCVTQAIGGAFKKVDKRIFVVSENDFSLFVKNACVFAFRQYVVEQHLGLGNHWEKIIKLYLLGHCPVAFCENKLFSL